MVYSRRANDAFKPETLDFIPVLRLFILLYNDRDLRDRIIYAIY